LALTISLALAAPSLLAINTAQAADASTSARYSFAIARGPLTSQLARFAQQTGIELAGNARLTEGKTGNGLSGEYDVESGLATLLAGCGVKAVRQASGTYTLLAVEELELGATQVNAGIIAASDDLSAATIGYQGQHSGTTTKLGLTPQETPQGITIVTRDRMDDFKLDGVRNVLRNTPSVSVDQTETDRTYFTARGFDVTNFEYDGVGMPFEGSIVDGDLDTASYEQVDILHGANGLMSGTGNPSATVNFVRKRPTYTPQASVTMSYGSWDKRRIDIDVAGPLTETGNVRGRFIYANETGNSYLDRYSSERNLLNGLLAFDLTEDTTLTLGYEDQKSNANGVGWGALPLVDGNNSRIHYHSRSSNVGQDWTYWDVHTQRAFAELQHNFANGWKSTLNLTYVEVNEEDQLLYVYPDSATTYKGLPLYSRVHNQQVIGDLSASGPFSLAGREHQLTVGTTYGRSRSHQRSHQTDADGTIDVALEDVLAGNIGYQALPYTDDLNKSNFVDRQKSVYAGARFSLTDDLHLVTGARMLSADSDGDNYGADRSVRIHGKVTPYAGLVYDINDQYAVYASATKIFNPQYNLTADGSVLAPLEGKSYEMGIKGSLLEHKLNVSAAVFKTDQQNVALDTGDTIGTQSVYEGVDYKSRGIELEASGQLADGLQLSGGYTYTRIINPDDNRGLRYVPQHTIKTAVTYRVPQLPKLKVGASVNFQSQTENETDSSVYQNAYALVDLMGRYDIDEHWSTGLNVNNLTDRKYLLTLRDQTSSNYGEPRNVMASVTWKY
jgi:outer membrane receptor for ferric coprogen and ferric-rhodotorulic acid